MNYRYLFLSILINIIIVLIFNKKKNYLILDYPDNNRKTHSNPTPVFGGFFFFFNILLIILLDLTLTDAPIIEIDFIQNNYQLFLFFITCSTFFIIGLYDDKKNLNANIKFVLISLVILINLIFDKNLSINEIRFSFTDQIIFLKNLNIFFTYFSFLLFINAFNMFDGINLQNVLYTIIIFALFIVFNISINFFAMLFIVCLFFAYLNYKNKCFMGDSGTLLISYVISFFFIKSYNYNYLQYSDIIFVVMMIPGLDLLRVTIERILKKKNPFSGDRGHIHHLLIDKYSNYKTLFILLTLIITPIILSFYINNLLNIFLNICAYSIFICYLKKIIKI
jgi:UDP-GlcNAc:undecaprenyl-phosphate GlcNAc-1-phosphate transferase